MSKALIVEEVRIPIGKAPRGSLRHTQPNALAAFAIRALLERVPALNPTQIEDVIFSCATPEGESGMNIARVAALRAGLPTTIPGVTVNRFCASGLEQVGSAAHRVWSVPSSGAKIDVNGATTRVAPTYYRFIFTTSASSSSTTDTMRVFAWKPRWVTIMSANSLPRSTFDCSR